MLVDGTCMRSQEYQLNSSATPVVGVLVKLVEKCVHLKYFSNNFLSRKIDRQAVGGTIMEQ